MTDQTRSLPLLAVQAPAPSGDDPLGEFAADLRARVAFFPQTRLVLYPELHLTPPAGDAEMRRMAEPVPGELTEALCRLAAELSIWLVPGSIFERGDDGEIYNTAPAISPDGELVARYRKCFPWRPWEHTAPGDEFVVFDIPEVGRVGLSICYDSWFPEVARHLAWMGADVILSPTLTATADREQELVLARAAAIANQVFVVNLNAAGPTGTGASLIVDPEGHVLMQAGEGSLALTQVLDLEAVDRARRFGSAGLNRLWSQMRDGDPVLPLPLYEGALDPRRFGHGMDSGSRQEVEETTS